MRPISLSMIVMAGALMASVGAVAESFPASRFRNDLQAWGIALIVFSMVLYVIDMWLSRKGPPQPR
jgi:ABC-type branched-subunit amino acid transport system permease subunit